MFPPGMAGPPAGGHAPPEIVNAILARMHGGAQPPTGGPPPGQDSDQKPNGHGMSNLEVVQSIIQDIHDAMRIITDPQQVNTLATCLKAVTGIQQQMMATQGGK